MSPELKSLLEYSNRDVKFPFYVTLTDRNHLEYSMKIINECEYMEVSSGRENRFYIHYLKTEYKDWSTIKAFYPKNTSLFKAITEEQYNICLKMVLDKLKSVT